MLSVRPAHAEGAPSFQIHVYSFFTTMNVNGIEVSAEDRDIPFFSQLLCPSEELRGLWEVRAGPICV